MARDGMLAGSSCLNIANALFMDSRRHRYFPILRIFPLLRQCICYK